MAGEHTLYYFNFLKFTEVVCVCVCVIYCMVFENVRCALLATVSTDTLGLLGL